MIRYLSLSFAALGFSFFIVGAQAHEIDVKPLFQTDLKDLGNREGLMVIVDLAPGASSDVHRHNAHVFVYVLEGSVVMQVEGGERTELQEGQTFYENPEDIHVVGMNASKTAPAKFLAVFVKPKDAPVSTPVP